jgi:hypothetical protein
MAALAGDPPFAEPAVNSQDFTRSAIMNPDLRDLLPRLCGGGECGQAQRQECCAPRATGGGPRRWHGNVIRLHGGSWVTVLLP